MKRFPANPARFVELRDEDAPAQVGALIRSAIAAPAEDTPRVKWRIRSTLRVRVERRTRMLRLALVGILVFVVGGVVGAAVEPFLRRTEPEGAKPPVDPAQPTARMPGRRHAHAPTPAQPPAEEAPAMQAPALDPPAMVEATKPVLPAGPKGRPRVQSQTGAPPRPPAPAEMPGPPLPAPSPPSQAFVSQEERQLIATALESLRSSHRPDAALAAVDEYRARFPAGALLPEAARLRTEALLALGRNYQVLREMEQTTDSDPVTANERGVLRGELRAAAGHWQAALADFETVLAAHPTCDRGVRDRTQERLERALWGRATARSHLGDEAGAIADLRHYLHCFPQGRFSQQASALLEGRP